MGRTWIEPKRRRFHKWKDVQKKRRFEAFRYCEVCGIGYNKSMDAGHCMGIRIYRGVHRS